jgi:hypothetical protein
MSIFHHENRKIILLAFVGYVLLLVRHGYTFGWGDHAEILPYLSNLQDATLYPKDFYVQYIKNIIPNVRWIFVHTLLPFYAVLEPTFFILHALCSILLLSGTLKIARVNGFQLLPSFAGLMTYLLVFYGKIPGGNDWYLNNFQSESIAFTAGMTALLFWFQRKFIWSYLMLSVGTFFHPLAGIQFFILITGLSLITRQWNYKAFFIYLLTGGVYFLLIFLHQGKTMYHEIPTYFDILFQFRQPHHSMPEYYPMIGWLLTGLFSLALWFKRKQAPELLRLMLLILSGALVYVIGVSVFHLTPVAQTQWFKTFALLFALGSMAGGDWIYGRLRLQPIKLPVLYPMMAAVAALLLVALFAFPDKNPLKKPFTIAGYQSDPLLIHCSVEISKKFPKEALFVVPFDCDAFNYYSQRSVYVSFKSVAHDERGMREWYHRIGQVYGLKTSDGGGYTLSSIANQYYLSQLISHVNGMPIGFNADYALVKGHLFSENVVFENAGYQVISLKTDRLYAQKVTSSK